MRALLATATQRRRTARAVVAFALSYNAVAVALCLAGFMSPLLAAILMPASSLVSLAIGFIGFRSRSGVPLKAWLWQDIPCGDRM